MNVENLNINELLAMFNCVNIANAVDRATVVRKMHFIRNHYAN